MTRTNVQPEANDKAAARREMRGKGSVARDAVRREANSLVVSTLSLRDRGRKTEHRVSGADNENLVCTCSEFKTEAESNQKFACEHIYAARLWQKEQRKIDDIWKDGERERRESEEIMNAKIVENRLNGIEKQALREAKPSDETASSASLIVSADVKASDERQDFSHVLGLLRQPINEKLIRVREGWTDRSGRKHLVEYIEWHTVADLLDRVCPSWSHRVKSISQIGEIVAVVASLTIGDVTREGIGTGGGDTETGIKKAEHDALKRAAVKFGIARELYQREGEAAADIGESAAAARKSFSSDSPITNPQAKGMSDLVTPKQLGMIRRLAQESGVDAASECRAMYECEVEELSRRAASKLIESLMSRAGAKKQTLPRAG